MLLYLISKPDYFFHISYARCTQHTIELFLSFPSHQQIFFLVVEEYFKPLRQLPYSNSLIDGSK